MTAVPTSEELVTLFDDGKLFSEMAFQFRLNDPVEVHAVEARCVALHNGGTVDLLRLIEGDMHALNGANFFMASHFFCRILPDLDATPARMMVCVEALVTRGGQDLAATRPNVAFRTWCANEPGRAREVIVAARSGDDLAGRHLTFALEAINDITEARHIALSCNDARRLSAITALSRIADDDPASRAETLAVFDTLLGRSADDSLRASLLHATVAVTARSRDTPSLETVALVRRLVDGAGELTVHQAASALWSYREAMQSDIVAALLEALARLNPINKGTVKELDLGLQSLLELGHDQAAIDYVTQLLSRPDNSLGLEDLDSFTRTLLSGKPERLSRVVVHWLLLGAPRLCEGLADAITSRDLDGPPLDLRAEDLAISPAAQVFICRKAIGWFFLKPTMAASVLVSVLRVCDPETALEVQKHLVEPLLMNYDSVREYLEGLPADDVARGRIDEALTQNAAYLKAMQAVPRIKEMRPSEHRRRIERLRMADQMRDAHKQAQSQSVLLSLVKKSVLLYGNRSLSFVRDDQGALRPVEMDLQSHGVSFEMPRMEIVDPVGLDLSLRVFRRERMVQ